MKPCTIDMRLTTDWDSNTKGMHMFYPFGIFSQYLHQGHRIEFPLGRMALLIEPDAQEGYTYVYDQSLQSMYKFVTPTKVSDEYERHEFYSFGIRYILELRIVSFLDGTYQ